MGMGAFAILVALLVLALVLGGLTAGLALLIVGLAKDRRGMWITGLVLLLMALAIAAAVGLTFLPAWPSGPPVAPQASPRPA